MYDSYGLFVLVLFFCSVLSLVSFLFNDYISVVLFFPSKYKVMLFSTVVGYLNLGDFPLQNGNTVIMVY